MEVDLLQEVAFLLNMDQKNGLTKELLWSQLITGTNWFFFFYIFSSHIYGSDVNISFWQVLEFMEQYKL